MAIRCVSQPTTPLYAAAAGDDELLHLLWGDHLDVVQAGPVRTEGHDHPRPSIVAASATTGYLEIQDDTLVTPLVYSTELARSINLGKPSQVTIAPAAGDPSGDPAGETVLQGADLARVRIDARVTKAGDLNPTTVAKRLDRTYVVAGVIHGLVNVRTDGETLLCATLNEKDNTWQIKTFTSRF